MIVTRDSKIAQKLLGYLSNVMQNIFFIISLQFLFIDVQNQNKYWPKTKLSKYLHF